MKKISIIGAGQVGASTAAAIAQKGLGNVTLIDIDDGLAKGKALDLYESLSCINEQLIIEGSSDMSKMAGSDIVVITAGLPRKPGMTREDLLNKNFDIIKSVASKVKEYANDAFVIIVTNPLDVMAYAAFKMLGFKKNKVMGMAGILDTSRLKTFISEKMDVSVQDIQAMILGSHGDSMVPVKEYITVSGIPITQLMDDNTLESVMQRARDGGAEIVKLLKTGSAFYAPAASVVVMIESILKDQKRLLPCSVYTEGEYGYNNLFIGLPAVLGKSGVEKIIELKLSSDAKNALDKSAAVVKENISLLKI